MYNLLNKIYISILKSPFWAALIITLSFFTCKNSILANEFYLLIGILLIISILAVLKFNKRLSFKESFKFGLWLLLFSSVKDIILTIITLKTTMFSELTIIYYGLSIVIGILIRGIIRSILGFLIYYLTNTILYYLFNRPVFKKIGEKIKNHTHKTLFFILLTLLIIAIPLTSYVIKTMTGVSVKIDSFEEIFDNYRYGFGNKIYVMPNNKICFLRFNKQLFIYDLKQHLYTDKIILPDDTDELKYEYSTIKPLKNGNILIIQNAEPKDRTKFYKVAKTVIKIYSQKDKKFILTKDVTPIIASNEAQIELADNNIIFIGGTYKDFKKTFILNVDNNSIKRVSDLNFERDEAKAISLDDGRIFVFGGGLDKNYPDNYAEIYNPKNDTFAKIPLEFIVHNYAKYAHLSKMTDGRILILTERAYDNDKEGYTGSHGFRVSNNSFVTVHPAPYLTIFNPTDNSFEEIDINKNSKYLRSNYDAIAIKDNKVVILGGNYVSKKTHKVVMSANDILIYDTKARVFNKASKNLKFNHKGRDISTILDDGRIFVTGNIYNTPTSKNQIEVITIE